MKTICRLALMMAAGALLVTSLPLRAAEPKTKDGGVTLATYAKATSEAQNERMIEYAKDVAKAVDGNKTTSDAAPLEPLPLNLKLKLWEMPVAVGPGAHGAGLWNSSLPGVPARLEGAIAMKSPLVHPVGSRPVWVSGVLVEAVKGRQLLQLVNPFAPKHYDLGGRGMSVISVSW